MIVLVTIDAFRCGFGQAERPELRDVCPELTERLPTARYRLDAYATGPSTRVSTTSMQKVADEPIGELLRRAGFRTSVIATHERILEGPGVRASFDDVDEALAPQARAGVQPTSEQTTDRALAVLRSATRNGGKHFLWVHYYDPHDPYVEDPESPWSAFPRLRAYAAEVRRTDREVARLLSGFERELATTNAVFLLTADHGEEFGEHGASYHGRALYDESTRIPVVVWASTEAQRRSLPAALPAGSHEVGEYLIAAAFGRTFHSSEQTILIAQPDDDEQRGLARGGWKLIEHRTLGYTELFDTRSDPREQYDLSRARPDKLLELRCALMRAE